MTLKEMPKRGDVVKYVGTPTPSLTDGQTYVIRGEKDCGSATFKDNDGNGRYILSSLYDQFELVEETEPQPDVHALLANLARRLSEVEAAQERASFEAIVDDFEEAVADLSGEGNDVVNSPSHYTQGAIEVIDYIDQVAEGYEGKQAVYVANVIKYVSRAPYKNGIEDAKKATWYLARLVDAMEADK